MVDAFGQRYPLVRDEADGTFRWGTNVVEIGVVPDFDVTMTGGFRNETYWRPFTTLVGRSFSTSETNEVDDVVVIDYLSDAVFWDAQAEIDYIRGFPEGDVQYSFSPTSIGTIDETGFIETIAPGFGTVGVTIGTETKTAPVFLNYSDGDEWRSWVAGVAGSVRLESQEQLDDAIADIDGTPDTLLFSTFNNATGEYVWNTNCWMYGRADLSGVVVSSRRPGGNWSVAQWHGTLITPRHIALPKHCIAGVPNVAASSPEPVGTMKRFVGQSGTVHERTVIAHYDPFGDPDFETFTNWNMGNDTIIGLLDTAVPTNDVAVYAVMPTNAVSYSPTRLRAMESGVKSEGGAAGALWTNLDIRVYGAELGGFHSFRSTPWSPRSAVHRVGRVGDSGRPVFLWLDGQLVFLFTLTWPTAGFNWAVMFEGEMWNSNYRQRVEAILALHGETLTDADLSGYATFD